MRRLVLCLLASPVFATPVVASEDIPDQYPQSVLYAKPVEVIPHVFSAIGATAPPTPPFHGSRCFLYHWGRSCSSSSCRPSS